MMVYPPNPTPGNPAMQYPVSGVGMPIMSWQPYDEAVQKFLTQQVYLDKDSPDQYVVVEPVMNTPRLERSTQDELHPDEIHDENHRDTRLVYPTASLVRLNETRSRRRWTRAHYRKLGWTAEGNHVIQSDHPIPYDVTYQLDLLAKYNIVMNQLLWNIQTKFPYKEVWLEVDLEGPWGVKKIPLFLEENAICLTEFDPGDKDLVHRYAFTFTLEAWVLPKPNIIPAVRNIQIDVAIPVAAGQPSSPDFPGYVVEKVAEFSSREELPELERP